MRRPSPDERSAHFPWTNAKSIATCSTNSAPGCDVTASGASANSRFFCATASIFRPAAPPPAGARRPPRRSRRSRGPLNPTIRHFYNPGFIKAEPFSIYGVRSRPLRSPRPISDPPSQSPPRVVRAASRRRSINRACHLAARQPSVCLVRSVFPRSAAGHGALVPGRWVGKPGLQA